MAADYAASGGLSCSGGLGRDELYILFLSAVFSGGFGSPVLPDAPEKAVAGSAGRQLFLLLAGFGEADCLPADHNGVGLSGRHCHGAGAESF